MDMDGVLVREQTVIPGADRFVARLREIGRPFLVLTNNSMYTPRDFAASCSPSAWTFRRIGSEHPSRIVDSIADLVDDVG